MTIEELLPTAYYEGIRAVNIELVEGELVYLNNRAIFCITRALDTDLGFIGTPGVPNQTVAEETNPLAWMKSGYILPLESGVCTALVGTVARTEIIDTLQEMYKYLKAGDISSAFLAMTRLKKTSANALGENLTKVKVKVETEVVITPCSI